MGKASRIMYTIANVFNWIALIAGIAMLVLSILGLAHVLPEELASQLGVATLFYSILTIIVAIVIIFLVRKAKQKGSSKGWDILFIVLGALEFNVFYILGGIFGLVARE